MRGAQNRARTRSLTSGLVASCLLFSASPGWADPAADKRIYDSWLVLVESLPAEEQILECERFLKNYPDNAHGPLVRARLDGLRAAAALAPPSDKTPAAPAADPWAATVHDPRPPAMPDGKHAGLAAAPGVSAEVITKRRRSGRAAMGAGIAFMAAGGVTALAGYWGLERCLANCPGVDQNVGPLVPWIGLMEVGVGLLLGPGVPAMVGGLVMARRAASPRGPADALMFAGLPLAVAGTVGLAYFSIFAFVFTTGPAGSEDAVLHPLFWAPVVASGVAAAVGGTLTLVGWRRRRAPTGAAALGRLMPLVAPDPRGGAVLGLAGRF